VLVKKWGHKRIIIANRTVATLYGEWLAIKCQAELLTVSSSYLTKSREQKEWLENELLARKCGRDTLIIALGGGEIIDVVGYLASTYLRGVPLVLIPTTLLAIVDASIGGKTAVDTPHGKNLIGSYYPAKAIISDLDTLDSLPDAEWQNGLAEILKAALIADQELWALCDEHWREPLLEITRRAAQVKIATIEKDPLEKGLRRILNFGHTVAHALEAMAKYQVAHGEMVAIGLLAESYLSMRLGLLPLAKFEEIDTKISRAGFQLRLPANYDRAKFLEAMRFDKKASQGSVRFTLLEEIGRAASFDGEYCRFVSEERVQEMAAWMETALNSRTAEAR
jgi:3-dehydroquinate synthase